MYTSFEYKRGGYFTTVEMEPRAMIASRWKRNQELRLWCCENGAERGFCGGLEERERERERERFFLRYRDDGE